MKTCFSCKVEKSLKEFSKNKAAIDGLNTYCRPCHNKKTIEYKRKHPETFKESALKSRNKRKVSDWHGQIRRAYGITPEYYQVLFDAQNGKCVGCDKTPKDLGYRLCVDHKRSDGKIRGLMCRSCNLIVGNDDNIAIILMNLAYYAIIPTCDRVGL